MRSYSDYLSDIFPGIKVQKLSVDAGFTCPNRDGRIGRGGCIYCRNDSFTPRYCNPEDSVKTQIEKGRNSFGRKYPEMKYLAYFQSYTSTYDRQVYELAKIYEEAISSDDIVGLVIATRPDCIGDDIVDLLKVVNQEKPVIIELGAETSHDETLRLINRNHTWAQVEETIGRISAQHLHCGLHLIAGLPGETEELILETIDRAVKLPIETLKLHQLQVLKGTPLLEKIQNQEIRVPVFSLEEYLKLCVEIVERVPEHIVIERFLSQSPPNLVVSPSWGLKNYEFMNLLKNRLKTKEDFNGSEI